MSTNRTGRQYQYGRCLNDNCPKCKSKEIQQIAARKELVCSECGQPLRECPAPKSAWDKHKKLIIAAAAVLVLAVVGAGVFFGMSGDEKTAEPMASPVSDSITVDTPVVAEPEIEEQKTDTMPVESPEAEVETHETEAAIPESAPKAKKEQTRTTTAQTSRQETAQLGCGRYEGPMSGNVPDGIGGTVYVTSSHQIDLKDGVGGMETISPGDKIVNTKFKNGVLQQGQIIKSNGERKYISGLSERL